MKLKLRTSLLCAGSLIFALQGCTTDKGQSQPPQTSSTAVPAPLTGDPLSDAQNGDAAAMVTVGRMYLNGTGVANDDHQAFVWFSKAADLGSTDGQYYLGRLYAEGSGVERSYGRAIYWYNRAANRGHTVAQYDLAMIYSHGWGVPKDSSLAYSLFLKAANHGNADAQYWLSSPSRQAGEHDDRALYWLQQAATNGHSTAQSNLGIRYLIGDGVPKDLNLAARWMEKSANQGDAAGEYNLAHLYFTGEGVERNPERAAELYRQSAEQGWAASQFMLGTMYGDGNGIRKDLVIAKALLTLAERGHVLIPTPGLDQQFAKMNAQQLSEAQDLADHWKLREPLPTMSQTWHDTEGAAPG
ncbi:tetratricopeptide repeat protein [Radicibacter daui]|uniref:tetratricopeptide repeat protein n=1 Tax=Radicibacter daui TaxID=3064829 RepID=UPI004046C6CD